MKKLDTVLVGEFFSKAVAKEMKERGMDTIVVCPADYQRIKDKFEIEGTQDGEKVLGLFIKVSHTAGENSSLFTNEKELEE